MDKLKTCAAAFNELLNINYYCVIGRKGQTREFSLVFDTYHFHHLSGLHKLSDVQEVRGNRERVFKNILSDSLTYEMIGRSKDFPLIETRLDYLHLLEQFMDSNSIIFNYDKRKNNSSRIEAVYLLSNDIDGNTIYLFIDKDSADMFFGRTFFPKGLIDFTIAQPQWTFLYKEKINTSTDERIIQYDELKKS